MTDIFSRLSDLRVDSMATAPGVSEITTYIPVRKPPSQDFFRLNPNPDCQLKTVVFQDKEERETYLIDPSMRSILVDGERHVIITLGLTRSGVLFFYPVMIPDPSGRRQTWAESALEVKRHAEVAWVRVVADMSLGGYRIYQAEGQLTEPVWPDKPFSELLKIAFANRVIDTPDHAVVRRLRGLA